MSRFLSIDFGLKHLGLAISDGYLAEPYGEVDNSNPQRALSRLARICESEGVGTIVIGLSEQQMAEATKAFGQELERVTSIPVVFVDETLTSQEATRKLVEGGARKKKRQTTQHQVAAAMILQEYLDSREKKI